MALLPCVKSPWYGLTNGDIGGHFGLKSGDAWGYVLGFRRGDVGVHLGLRDEGWPENQLVW